MKTNHEVVVEILKGHPIYSALMIAENVPLLYEHIQYVSDNGNHHFISRADHFTITFGVNKMR